LAKEIQADHARAENKVTIKNLRKLLLHVMKQISS